MLSSPSHWSFSKPVFSGAAACVPAELESAEASALEALFAAVDAPYHEGLNAIKPALYASPWVVNCIKTHPERFEDYLNSPQWQLDLAQTSHAQSLFKGLLLGSDEALASMDEAQVKHILRVNRMRHMVCIAVRDLMGWASLDETLMALSELATDSIRAAVAWAEHSMTPRYGVPRTSGGANDIQKLLVLGMGKMGGGELNFSSDIDLIFFYPEAGQTDGDKCVDNGQYFTRLGQTVIRLLDERTVDGFVFRVDMRLRPFGDSGALAINFDSVENYYLTQGREWERYAMIKAVAVTGEAQDINYLQSILKPFVYRRYLDFSAIQSLRDLKAMINEQVHKKGMEDNIKLGRGGIREIEFIGQAFQLIYGGKNPALRVRSIMTVLQTLGKDGMLQPCDVTELQAAYAFLRFSENRLQMLADEQTHNLPTNALEQARLAYSMGFDDWGAYLKQLNQHRQRVASHFANVFEEKNDEKKTDAWRSLWLSLSEQEAIHAQRLEEAHPQAVALLTNKSFDDPADVLVRLSRFKRSVYFKRSTLEGQQRLDAFMPVLLYRLAKTKGEYPCSRSQLLQRVLPLVQSIARRSVYLVLLQENPKALKRLLNLMAQSQWLSEQMIAQPLLLDQLVDARMLYAIEQRPLLDQSLNEHMRHVTADELSECMNELRRFKSAYTFRVAAVDLSDRMPLMRVSDHLTECAEVLVERTHQLAWSEMIQRYGVPTGKGEQGDSLPSMGVIGYGKLGGVELGYASDLDLVFVHDSEGANTITKGNAAGKGVIDNTLFFARLAQKFSSIMNTQTHMGQLYEVDVRLRPDGNSGEWVKALSGFEHYQKNKAWTWEHQALVRARFISGQPHIKQAFERIRHDVLCLPRDRDTLRQEVLDMREKMRQSLAATGGKFSLKQNRGGLADIEFIVQYLVLGWSHCYPELTQWTDNIRALDKLAHVGLLSVEESHTLVESYRAIRARIHRLALDKRKAVVTELGGLQPFIDASAQIWQRIMVDDVLYHDHA